MEIKKKHYLVIGVILLAVAATAFQFSREGPSSGNVTESSWQEIQLEDVRTGESYTVAELEKPVLVETFAVWCPTCTRQQQAVKEFEKDSEVTSVSLDVDPNEDAQKIRDHVERHGFEWRYSVAPPEMSKELSENYGNVMLNPPSAPMVLVCEKGTRKLPTGVKPPSKLQQEVNKGC